MADINVLVVVDGIFRLKTEYPDPDPNQWDDWFTLSHLVKKLKANTFPTISVDTANRVSDPDATIATNRPFRFDDPTVNLSSYDEIWLFGYEGTNYDVEKMPPDPPPGNLDFIQPTEISAIAEFMNGGGGVLATGDHDGLGSLMCRLIPRIRTMRAWFSVKDTDPRIPAAAPRNWPGDGPGRADTLQPAADQSIR